MRFYLGTGARPHWLRTIDVPLFIPYRWLAGRRTFPRARYPWAMDSGGFTQLERHGRWTISPADYVAGCRRIIDGVGMPAFVAPQDWMVEPHMLERTGLTISEHQRRTVDNFLTLRDLAPEIPYIPVLQGWALEEYLECWQLYSDAGVDLVTYPTVGLGSVCRRQDTSSAEAIVLALRPLRLHGFGIKRTGIASYGYLLASSDSMAWSYSGRKRRMPPGHPNFACSHGHEQWQNCPEFALAWREAVIRSLEYQQLHLEGV